MQLNQRDNKLGRYLLHLVLLFALFASSCTTEGNSGKLAQNSNAGEPRKIQPEPAPTAPVPAPKFSESKAVRVTDANHEEVIRSQNVVLLFFWAEWSAPDRMMIPVVEGLANDYSGRVKIGQVNVDDNPAVARKFNIKGIPTVVVIKDGSEQERVVGVTSRKSVSLLLDKQL